MNHKEAVIIIDMQNGFIDPASPLCVAGAQAAVPVCAAVMNAARTTGRMTVYMNRSYRDDGTDVERTRYAVWNSGGRPLSPGCPPEISAQNPPALAPQPGDFVIRKPRFSAFFNTDLDLLLRRRRIKKIYLIGTATPNCIRTTCYDGLSLDYEVTIIEDACSSATPEIQQSNIDDMRRIGAEIISADTAIHRWTDD